MKRPDAERVIDGVRFRAYRRRTEIEVLRGDGDIEDQAAEVWCYPKQMGAEGAIAQAALDTGR